MFTCKSCTTKLEGEGHYDTHTLGPLGISRGKCEVCGKTADCVDCKCYKTPATH